MAQEATKEYITVEDYLAGELVSEVKHEYLGGTVHAMAGGKMRHNLVASNALGLLHSALKGKTCKPYNSDTKVRIQLPSQIRFYYPDLQVICDPVDADATFTDEPVVVAEVFSDSTRRLDAGEKRDAYLTIPSLKVLVLIDPEKIHINVDRRHPDGGFEQETYRSLDETINLPEIKASLKVADVYEGIRF